MRPRCPDCGKPLQPSVERLYEANLVTPYARRWRGTWDAYQGLWCTLRCALRFATRAHAAGFRRVRGS